MVNEKPSLPPYLRNLSDGQAHSCDPMSPWQEGVAVAIVIMEKTWIQVQIGSSVFTDLAIIPLTFHIDLGLGLVIRTLTAVKAPVRKGDVLNYQDMLCSLSFDLYFFTWLQYNAVPHPLDFSRLGQLYLQGHCVSLFNSFRLQFLLEWDWGLW